MRRVERHRLCSSGIKPPRASEGGRPVAFTGCVGQAGVSGADRELVRGGRRSRSAEDHLGRVTGRDRMAYRCPNRSLIEVGIVS